MVGRLTCLHSVVFLETTLQKNIFLTLAIQGMVKDDLVFSHFLLIIRY